MISFIVSTKYITECLQLKGWSFEGVYVVDYDVFVFRQEKCGSDDIFLVIIGYKYKDICFRSTRSVIEVGSSSEIIGTLYHISGGGSNEPLSYSRGVLSFGERFTIFLEGEVTNPYPTPEGFLALGSVGPYDILIKKGGRTLYHISGGEVTNPYPTPEGFLALGSVGPYDILIKKGGREITVWCLKEYRSPLMSWI
ncbi:hypothetical protein WA026_019485 [Henosepilachna vigintioctopunctata]|uniref:Uncharacterized protein n=1 Tax=Henosepilachna vigintioctopunctata TaxID=420089 RepID=A0AAW1UCL2_9CUCU